MRHATETYRCTLFKKSKCSHFACVDTLFLAFLPISTIYHSLILSTLVGLRPVCQPLAPRSRIKNVWLRTSIITGLCEKFLLASYSSEVITIRPNSPHSHAGLIIQGYKDPIFLTSGSKCFRRVEAEGLSGARLEASATTPPPTPTPTPPLLALCCHWHM